MLGSMTAPPGETPLGASKRALRSRWSAGWLAVAALPLALIGMLGLPVPSTNAADPEVCPNAKYRTGPSLFLPDCRAYEMITPPAKANEIATSTGSLNPGLVTPDGNTILYLTATGPTADTASNGIPTWERATRSESGWSVRQAIAPVIGPYVDTITGPPRWMVTNPQLDRHFFSASAVFSPDQAFDPGGSSQRNGGVFLADDTSATWISQPTSPNALPAQGTADANPTKFMPVGASSDMSILYFNSAGTLTLADDSAGRVAMESWATYKWKNGVLSNAGVLPDGTLSPGGSIAADRSGQSLATSPPAADQVEMSRHNAVSDDGRSFLFVSPDPDRIEDDPSLPKPQLYMAIDGQGSVLLSAPEGESQPATGTTGVRPTSGRQTGTGAYYGYAVATPDHSVVLFSTADALTDDADATATVKTYRYERASGSLTYLPDLDRINPVTGTDTDHGRVLDLSDSGNSMLYRTGDDILRLWRKGEAPVTIATGVERGGNAAQTSITHARFSIDENVIVMNSTGPLRGEPDHLPGSGTSTYRTQVYRYTVDEDDLECISCPPGGSNYPASFTIWGAKNGVAGANLTFLGYWSTQGMTADGSTVYFTTAGALVPEDHNSTDDVYQWRDGELSLISTGASGSRGERLYDTTPDGSSVFIASPEQLVPADQDEYYDVYVARVNGGFDPPAPPVSDSGCAGDQCQGPAPAGPALPAVASVNFAGSGNVANAHRPRVAVARLRSARGPVARLRVRVPAAGRVVLRGGAVRSSARRVGKAGTYNLRVVLKPRARRMLKRRGAVRPAVRVTFRSADGTVSRRVRVAFKQPKAKRSRQSVMNRKGR